MNRRQLQYLRNMDIDVWQRRELADIERSASQAQSVVSITRVPADTIAKLHTEPVIANTALANDPLPINQVLTTWQDVELAVRNCTRCSLHETRTQTVFGVGNRQAQWMIVGEAPGADEDREGEPFVGRAGQLLNSMLLAIGFKREDVFIANVLKCRPPNNRDPRPDEVNCCMPYLQRQIELVNPRMIVCVGRIAAQNLLATDTPIGKLRGRVHYLGERRRPVVVTYHPAYLLRSPVEKRKAWSDLQLALETFATHGDAVP